ncbi:hypothetical protein AGMMS49983_01460 [Clostridia bacterium]|nr:hypothetical protein AGMMS49983_01460 [Clostridia bacterium]
MTYHIVTLSNYLEQNTEERTTEILSSFSCPDNQDIENFLKNNAVSFSKQGIAQTHLVSTLHNGENIILGYFALTLKAFSFRDHRLSINRLLSPLTIRSAMP